MVIGEIPAEGLRVRFVMSGTYFQMVKLKIIDAYVFVFLHLDNANTVKRLKVANLGSVNE